MIITLTSFKGGVGKTTSAIHLAAYLQQHADTLLIDGDPNGSARQWAAPGKLPFTVADEKQAPKLMVGGKYQHFVIDTPARPEATEIESLASGCDLLILPCSPDALAIGALMQMIEPLQQLRASFKILLTLIPPRPSKAGDEARDLFKDAGLPMFDAGIRRLAAFQWASTQGVTVDAAGDKMSGIAWDCYKQVGKEIDV
jgi:chromosome partitioning protein